MASLSNSRALFAFTSPRTIEKIIPEIRLLVEKFSGQRWDTKLQARFFEALYESEFYEGASRPSDVTLAARDRITRAPKALGFVDLDPTIQLTDVGTRLLQEKRLDEIFTRQLLKFQLPSPYHTDAEGRFFVKPYLEFLRMVYELGSLSKSEVAIFFLQLIHLKDFERIKKKIRAFRNAAAINTKNRKAFVEDVFTHEVLKLYASDLKAGKTRIRESGETSAKNFVSTKKSNLRDYADAFIRYMRATQLITFNTRDYRIIISPSKQTDVEFILASIPREPVAFDNESQFKTYLFTSNTPVLLADNRAALIQRLSALMDTIPPNLDDLGLDELKDMVAITEEKQKTQSLEETSQALKSYREYDDIMQTFQQIRAREMPDPPLYLEWNVWRALTMLNYALAVNGNFSIDLDGIPLNTAIGNRPDIECEYDTFRLIVEVTMSSGNKQYEMEGEPVARHFGNIQKDSTKPLYCLFIAPKISEGALAHFFNLNRMQTKMYGGKTRIIPLSLDSFQKFVQTARDKNFSDSNKLESYLNQIVTSNQNAQDEELWMKQIQQSISNWC